METLKIRKMKWTHSIGIELFIYTLIYIWYHIYDFVGIYIYIYIYTGCAKKRYFKYKYKIVNDQYILLKIKLTTHNHICGQMTKYEVCILNIHCITALYALLRFFGCEHGVHTFTVFHVLNLTASLYSAEKYSGY